MLLDGVCFICIYLNHRHTRHKEFEEAHNNKYNLFFFFVFFLKINKIRGFMKINTIFLCQNKYSENSCGKCIEDYRSFAVSSSQKLVKAHFIHAEMTFMTLLFSKQISEKTEDI